MSREVIIAKNRHGNFAEVKIAKTSSMNAELYFFLGHIVVETMPRKIVSISTNIPLKKFIISYGEDMKMRINGKTC